VVIFEMKKFLILYMAPASAVEAQMKARSPEEIKKGMEPWMAWFKKCGKSIVDNGNMVGNGMNFTKTGSSKGKTEVAGLFYCASRGYGRRKSNNRQPPTLHDAKSKH
jgi:hypothetical protein